VLPAFEDAKTLKEALKNAIVPPIILGTPFVHFTSRWAVWWKKFRNK
jgi:hypothetical protein